MNKKQRREKLFDFISKHARIAVEKPSPDERKEYLKELRTKVKADALEAGFAPDKAEEFAKTFADAAREQVRQLASRRR